MQLFLESLGTPGPAIFAVAGFLAAAFWVGRFVLAKTHASGPEAFFLALIVGIDLLILTAMPLLWLGSLPRFVLFILFTAALAACGFGALRFLVRARSCGWNGAIPRYLLPFVAMGLLLSVNVVFYPYVWDELTYQLAVPSRWLRDNSLAVYRDNPYSGFPGANLVANLLLIKAGGILAPAAFNFALGMVVAVSLHFLLRPQVSPWAATILSLAFVLTWPFLMVMTAAYAEPLILVQFIGIFFVLGRIPQTGRKGDWLLIGFLAGCAAAVKLTAAILPAAMTLLLAFELLRRREWHTPRLLLTKVGSFLGPLLVVVLLFYARPFLATGNPLYPYCASLFTDWEETLAMSRFHHDAGRAQFGVPLKSPGQTVLYFCWTPVLLTSDSLAERAAGNPLQFDGTFGWQFAVLIFLVVTASISAVRRRPIDPRLLTYLALAFFFYTCWFFTAQQARFLLHGLLCLVLASALAMPLFSQRGRKFVLGLILILTLGNLPTRLVQQVILGWEIAAKGKGRAEDFVSSATQDGYLKACQAIQDNTPSSPPTKVLLLYEQRGLYVPRPYVIGTPYFQELLFTPPSKTATDDEFMETLRREKITHVLIGFAPKDPDRLEKYMDLGKPFQNRIKQCSEQERLKLLWSGNVGSSRVAEFALFEVDLR